MLILIAKLSGFTQVYGYALVALIAYMTYQMQKEAFLRAWVLKRVTYSIFKDGIEFNWEKIQEQNLFVPFDEIRSITPQSFLKEEAVTIYFEWEDEKRLKEFKFLSDDSLNHLCFHKVPNGNEALGVLKKYYKLIPQEKQIEDPVKLNPQLIAKTNLLFAFAFILFSSYLLMSMIDLNWLESKKINDSIVSQEVMYNGDDVYRIHYETAGGYDFRVNQLRITKDDKLELEISPVFNRISAIYLNSWEFSNAIQPKHGVLFDSAKFLISILLFSTSFIILKARGKVNIEDLTFLVLFPILLTVFVFCLFSL